MNIISLSKKGKLLRQELFYFLSTLLAVLVLMEIIFPRIILAYFNLNYLLILVIFSGLLVLIKDEK